MKYIYILVLFITILGCDSNSGDFELCDASLHPYYYPELKYEGEFYAIKEHFYGRYQSVENGSNTGIVRIRFQVNCTGETGRYNMETYDNNYRKIDIESEITNQLMQLTQELDGWIPGKNDEGETVNSHKFFAFKITEGKLVDILPK
jgi:hypothetical protein